MENIILIGMPGCGKSTVGVILAKVMGYRFLDSDLLIQESENRLLSEIIEQDGLESFNEIENRVNASINVNHTVIATGGSVIYGKEAMEHFKEIGNIVYIKLPYEEISKRLGNLTKRGVSIKKGQTLLDLYNERVPLYEKYADIIVEEKGMTISETALTIKSELVGKGRIGMRISETGFYCINHNIYYGEYAKEQINGSIIISYVKPENIKTDKHFCEDDKAVTLYDNHALTEHEYINLENALDIILKIFGKEKDKNIDFSLTEQRLGIELPKEIKILYTSLVNFEFAFTGSERFLTLDEIYIDNNNLVFYKVKRTPTAISLSQGILMRYYKKNWEYSFGDENFLLYALDRLSVKIISQMPVCRKSKITGELKRTLNPHKILKEIYSDKLTVMEEYNNYGNIIMYNTKGALAWFRQNGFYADMMIGCSNEDLFNDIKSVKSDFITWI